MHCYVFNYILTVCYTKCDSNMSWSVFCCYLISLCFCYVLNICYNYLFMLYAAHGQNSPFCSLIQHSYANQIYPAYTAPHLYHVLLITISGFLCPWFSVCDCREEVGSFLTNKFTFSGNRAIMMRYYPKPDF